MSTKIYSGFEMQSRDVRQVLDDFARVQSKVEAVLAQRQATFIATAAAQRLDRLSLFGFPGYTGPWAPPSSAISCAVDELDKRQQKIRETRRRDPVVDFEVVFRLWLSRDSGDFIGYVRAEGAEDMRKILIDMGVAVEFGYWNNTDPDEGVTDEDWAERGRIWEGVLAGRSGPWFDVQVDEPISMYQVTDAVLKALPTFEQRVTKHARAIAFNGWAKAKVARDAESGRPDASAAVARFFEFDDMLRDGEEEVTEVHRAAVEQVRERLAPEITAEMLSRHN